MNKRTGVRQDCWGKRWGSGHTAALVECEHPGALSVHLRWLPTSCQSLGSLENVTDLNILPHKNGNGNISYEGFYWDLIKEDDEVPRVGTHHYVYYYLKLISTFISITSFHGLAFIVFNSINVLYSQGRFHLHKI